MDESEYASILEVEADLLDATIIGAPFSSVIDVATQSYQAHGFDIDEWHRHHQGGPTGFQASARLIQANQPIAWNPTGKGWKVEETLLTQPEGILILRGADNWPTRLVRGRIRPDLLRK
jgi:antitoxin VapB